MLELPEAYVVSNQLNNTIRGKRISSVTANYSPHKFTWFFGDPQGYDALLARKVIEEAYSFGGMVEIRAGNVRIVFGDGAGVKYHENKEVYPRKHQLLVEFEDSTAISASVQMYGGIWCFSEGEFDNLYYKVAKEKISPLKEEFGEEYFSKLISSGEVQKLSIKAFLATEQRVPGLGNGVLQDILWHSCIHPKRKVSSLSEAEKKSLFKSIKFILSEMVRLGGRDTEKDLFGNKGGYTTRMSKNTVSLPCVVCGGFVKKENYMGGSVYFCDKCQTI